MYAAFESDYRHHFDQLMKKEMKKSKNLSVSHYFSFILFYFFVSDSSMGGLRSFGRFDSVDKMNIHQKLYDFNGDDEDEDEDASNSHYT